MADITHDAATVTDDGFHEIQLSGKQLVFLFMLALVVLVTTFLCGVQVGRGVRTDRSLDAGASEALSTATPPPAASTPTQPVASSSGPPSAEPPAPAQEPEDELSYAKRLQGDKAPAEKLKSSPSPPAETRPPAETKAAPSVAARGAVTPPSPATAGKPGVWVVQLQALKNRPEAAEMAGRLAAKGYPAFVLDPIPGEPVYFRVQVGGYADRQQADQIARRLGKDEHLTPYVRRR